MKILESFVLSKEFVEKLKLKVIKYEMIECYTSQFTHNDRNLAVRILDESYHSIRVIDSIYIIFILCLYLSPLIITGYLIDILGKIKRKKRHGLYAYCECIAYLQDRINDMHIFILCCI